MSLYPCIISSFYLKCKLHDVTVCFVYFVFIPCFSFMEIVVVCICAALRFELRIFCIKKRLQSANYKPIEPENTNDGNRKKNAPDKLRLDNYMYIEHCTYM